MARHRPAGADATGATGGVPTNRYQHSPNHQNARFDDDTAKQPRRARQMTRAPGYATETARMVSRRTHRHRYAARPWLVLVPLIATALVLHLIPLARDLWWVLLLAGLVYAAAFQFPTRKHRPRPHLYYALACSLSASSWLAAVDACGTFHGLGRLAILTIAVPGFWPLSWWWWQYHRIRPATEPERAARPAPDPVRIAWADHVEPAKKLLPGARLLPREKTSGASAYVIAGVRGRDTTRKLLTEEFRHALSGALGLDPEQVSLERPPKAERNGRNARLLVIEPSNDQLRTEIPWPGPTLDRATGTWVPAIYADAVARCLLYRTRNGEPTRALNNAVSGLMGNGKSRFVELSVAEMLASGIFVVWYGDGQEGASAPGLRDHVDWYAIRADEVVRMLKAAWKIAKARQRHDRDVVWIDSHGYRRTGRGFWPATPDEPFIQVILDECQELLSDPRVAKLVKALQRLGPKVGIGVTLVTQEWLMYETGGASGDAGAQTIRSFAQTGLVVLFRSGSDINANALGGALAGVNPRTLPEEPGWCYLIGQGTRRLPARMYHIDPDEIYHRMATIANKAALDALAVLAAGDDYKERWERLDAIPAADSAGALDDIEAELDALLNGNPAAAGSTRSPLVGLSLKQAVLNIVQEHGPIKRADIDDALTAGGRVASKSTIDHALASFARTSTLVSLGNGIWDVPDREDRADADADAEQRAPQLEHTGQPDV